MYTEVRYESLQSTDSLDRWLWESQVYWDIFVGHTSVTHLWDTSETQLLSRGMWQEDQKFRVIFDYIVGLRLPWGIWKPALKKEEEKGKKEN